MRAKFVSTGHLAWKRLAEHSELRPASYSCGCFVVNNLELLKINQLLLDFQSSASSDAVKHNLNYAAGFAPSFTSQMGKNFSRF
jgi:hypothetical protein